jgi:Gpi18-like mannosyltransferase
MPGRGVVVDLVGAGLVGVLALLLAGVAYLPPRSVAYTVEALPVMLPREGLHEAEQLDGWSAPYRWTRGSATLEPANPGGAVVARLVLGGGPRRSVPVVARAGTFQCSFSVGPSPRTYALLLPPGGGERRVLHLASATMRERGRTLGVMLAGVRVSGGGRVPLRVALALALAVAGSYALLRQARVVRLHSAGIVLLLALLVLLWQVGGGWRYGVLGGVLVLVGLAALGAAALDRWVARGGTGRAETAVRGTAMGEGWWWLAGVVVVALCARLPWLAAPDPVGDLELAARRMWHLHTHGLGGAYIYDGDYMPLRLYLLYGLSWLVEPLGGNFHEPLRPATLLLIKLPALLADLASSVLIYLWGRRWHGVRCSALGAALYALSPPVWMNVAWWGQVDALLMLPLLGMVVLLERDGGRWGWLCWTVALLIKPQALIFAPLLYAATLRLHGSRGVAQGVALAGGVFVAACIPLVAAHQGPGLAQAYLGSVGRFPRLTIGAYNLWHLLMGGAGGSDTALTFGLIPYRVVGLLLVGGVALLVVVALLRRADGVARARGAAVLALAFFTLPTQIHERYLFLTLAFLVLGIASSEWLVVPYLLLVFTATVNILGTLDGFVPLATPHIATSPLPLLCALLNLGVLFFLAASLYRLPPPE